MTNNRGTYIADWDHIRDQVRDTTLGSQVRRIAPQGHIKRFVNIELIDHSVDTWNDFLNDFARKNDGVGRVRSLGNMAVTYIDTTQMGRIISKRFPQATQHEQLSTLNGIAREYNNFVHEMGSSTIERIANAEFPDDEPKLWLPVSLEFMSQLRPVAGSRTRRGFEFKKDARDLLKEEQAATRRFLKSEGFDSRNLDRGEPHLTIFEGHFPIGEVAIMRSDANTPPDVTFLAPVMKVMRNEPSKF
jgi:hypothetical protein